VARATLSGRTHVEAVVQAAHALDLCLFEKVGQFESGAGIAFRALQFLSDSRLTEGHTSDGRRDHGSRMVARRIGSSIVVIGLVAIPVELVSFFLFSLFPLDVGYPPGTPRLWYISLIGVWVHTPALMAGVDRLPHSSVVPVLLLSGYMTLFGVAVLVMFSYWLLKKAISSL
jgi:hypothetical protein